MKNKLKILITGPVAPPAGGISIHIERLTYLLNKEFDIELIDESQVRKPGIFNMRSLKLFTYLKKVTRADLLFVQGGNKLFKKIHIVTGRLFGKKVIITIHGYGNRRKQPFRAWDSFIYGLAHKIILVNDSITAKLPLPARKYVIKHAFLPPLMDQEPALPGRVREWIERARSKNEIIICANASRLALHNNDDLYGLDMSIEVTKRLLRKGYRVSFVYTVSALEKGSDLYNQGLQRIAEEGLQDQFMLISEKLSFVRLIENADIVIRPTNTDGDALTVREALFLGKPTIASDIVERPAGTVLFRTREINDLEEKLETCISNKINNNTNPLGRPGIPDGDFKTFYVDLINTVASD